MQQQQALLPFNDYNGQHLTVHLRGPRTTPQFVATGGLLHAYHPHTNEPLTPYEYPRTCEDLWEIEGQGIDAPFEDQVSAYVEDAAQILFELIQDTAELERVARRFKRRATPVRAQTADQLLDEQAAVNTYFGEVLEHYCLQLGAPAAEDLARWVAEVAETLDTPGPGNDASAARRGPRGFYDTGPS